ncbi:MAG: TonB-dependent receptor, partial [Flavobacteriales bacterium]|nr:TonB-dependent receptor [Flavobacteriales bacterium]
ENSFNNLVSPGFAINKRINKVIAAYAAYSSAYKAPVSSNILIATTGELNESLKPERGNQWEVGTKGNLLNNRLYFSAAYFMTTFENKFTAVAVQNPSNTATLYSYIVNGGAMKNNGLELLIKYKAIDSKDGFVKLLQPFANLTYSDFTYADFRYERIVKDVANLDSLVVEDYSGNRVAGVPPLVFNFGLDVDTRPGFYANITYNFRDAMYYTSDGTNEADAFALVNAKLGYSHSIDRFDLDVFGGANNILGTQYYQMVFINQLPDAYIPGPNEINFFGGIRLKYAL